MSKGELGSGFDCALVGEVRKGDLGFLVWVGSRQLMFVPPLTQNPDTWEQSFLKVHKQASMNICYFLMPLPK